MIALDNVDTKASSGMDAPLCATFHAFVPMVLGNHDSSNGCGEEGERGRNIVSHVTCIKTVQNDHDVDWPRGWPIESMTMSMASTPWLHCARGASSGVFLYTRLFNVHNLLCDFTSTEPCKSRGGVVTTAGNDNQNLTRSKTSPCSICTDQLHIDSTSHVQVLSACSAECPGGALAGCESLGQSPSPPRNG